MADHIDRVPGTARSPACPERAPRILRRNRRRRRDRPVGGVHRTRCLRPAGSAFGRRECRPGARSRSDGAAVQSHDRGPVVCSGHLNDTQVRDPAPRRAGARRLFV